MARYEHDLFVIGGGSGGVRAARMAAGAGAKVALAEADRMGGTCVIRGCVPKKLMVFAASFREMPAEARAYGWDIGDGEFDWGAFRGRLQAELGRLEDVYRGLLAASGVQVVDQRARIRGPHEVELADGRRVSAGRILIATGGRPVRPDIANGHLGLVSDDIFGLDRLPRTLLVVGGGFIACEMAGLLSGLGVAVTQYYRGAQILRGFDEEARGLIAEALRGQGVDLHCGTNVLSMGPADARMVAPPAESPPVPRAGVGPLRVRATNGAEKVFDAVLFATGRTPNVEDLGLDHVGIALDRRGAIPVDGFSATVVPSIHALGDVTDRVNLTPVAIRDAMAYVQSEFRGTPTPVDHDLIPSAVFTRPELGCVGLTEEAARDQEPIEVYATSFRPMRSAFAGAPDRVLMKLIVSRASRRVLGCHIVAPEAAEMIQLAAIAVKMGATKEDFDRVCAVHPTMAEELVTLRDPIRKT